MTMIEPTKRLIYLIETIPDLLNKLTEEEFAFKLQPEKWSKKEILGHLIDSATNNHHRLVRGQFENNPAIVYSQDDWCKYNFYQAIEKSQIISFWKAYNHQLIALFTQFPKESLSKTVNNLKIDFLIEDYVVHLEYHLKQIVDY